MPRIILKLDEASKLGDLRIWFRTHMVSGSYIGIVEKCVCFWNIWRLWVLLPWQHHYNIEGILVNSDPKIVASLCIWANRLTCQYKGFLSLYFIFNFTIRTSSVLCAPPHTRVYSYLPIYQQVFRGHFTSPKKNDHSIMCKTFSYNLRGPFGFPPCGIMEDVDVHSIHRQEDVPHHRPSNKTVLHG